MLCSPVLQRLAHSHDVELKAVTTEWGRVALRMVSSSRLPGMQAAGFTSHLQLTWQWPCASPTGSMTFPMYTNQVHEWSKDAMFRLQAFASEPVNDISMLVSSIEAARILPGQAPKEQRMEHPGIEKPYPATNEAR